MVTVQQIYDTTIHLMDEQNEQNGSTVTQDTDDYRRRTINILNMAIPAIWPYCVENERTDSDLPPMLNPEPYLNPDFSQPMPIDDSFCYSVMPLFLAHHLLFDEDAERSARYLNEYQMELAKLQQRNQIAAWETIQNPMCQW